MKKLYLYIISFAFLWLGYGCSDYLNIVPEGVPSMENAFSNRANSEKFLVTCYSYLPNFEHPANSVGFLGGDEFWLLPKGTSVETRFNAICWEIGRGAQNSNAPYMNYWDSGNNSQGANVYGGTNLWIGIRDCNIFLENIHKPQDLNDYERNRWIAEVSFLKAYYHFYLMQLYGPIPIMDKNIPVNAPQEEVRRYRDPFDHCVDYVVKILDDCMESLPIKIENPALEMGRITRPIAAAVKAQVLLFAASPLMNGNPDFMSLRDNRDVALFTQKEEASKWEKAADAALEAIQIAKEGGHSALYTFKDPLIISETTRRLLSIGQAVTERWNTELIWGATRSSTGLQSLSMAKLSTQNNNYQAFSLLGPTLSVVEAFYSKNGVPTNEDNSPYWTDNYADRFSTTTVPDEDINKYILEVGATTAKMHLNREYRFYSNLFFDRGTAYMDGLATDDAKNLYKLHFLAGEYSGRNGTSDYSGTGYLAKKLVGYRSSLTASAWQPYRYAFPIIRLADVYLMYAEALNETMAAPDAKVYEYIDLVRERAGLKGVVESWKRYSKNPNKPNTKEGMRDIIRKERLNELSLEGKRFWDLRRWKTPLPKAVKGWNVKGKTTEEFYRQTVLFERPDYYYRDYLWPLKISTILQNSNLVQNPGW